MVREVAPTPTCSDDLLLHNNTRILTRHIAQSVHETQNGAGSCANTYLQWLPSTTQQHQDTHTAHSTKRA
ncbi:hypothetical protein J6590_078092 [Homalodisca vitripennis]|nr:hypothetical protein J6590_078092 [Homalodisca vitripennis]